MKVTSFYNGPVNYIVGGGQGGREREEREGRREKGAESIFCET